MNIQPWLMLGVFILCSISSLDWMIRGEYPTGIAFLCFGLGDLALAYEFKSGGPWLG